MMASTKWQSQILYDFALVCLHIVKSLNEKYPPSFARQDER